VSQASERTPTRHCHGPDSSGPTGFGFAVRDRRKVVGWTRDERSARLLAWALTMSKLLGRPSYSTFIDWWVVWFGELSKEDA